MKTDVLVIGSGIAGCSAALSASDEGADVTLVTKAKKPEESNTKYAQGGIPKLSSGESADEFVNDVIQAGAGESDRDSVEVLVKEGTQAVEKVLIDEVGVEFDRDEDGFDLAREGAHSNRRVLHNGDATGKAIQKALLSRAEDADIDVLEAHMALELLGGEDAGAVKGALVRSVEDDDVKAITAGATVLATGGIGDVYGHTSNPDGTTGDGVAMAALAGAEVDDMEFVQFHPTVHAEKEYLLSEALRGEGALLVDANGERFMPEYHEKAELGPRDVVATAVDERRKEMGEVYLDLSPVFENTDFEEAFPTAYDNLTDEELESQRVPVKPAEHFLCGGIVVDDNGRTSIPCLYAAGETACSGVHGANRLASTSLLEGLTWGLRAGEDAANNLADFDEQVPDVDEFNGEMPDRFCDAKFDRLQSIMWKNVGIRRSEEGLEEAKFQLQRLRGEVKSYARGRLSPDLYALRNAVIVGLLITDAALENEESVGCHRRISS
ncbi:MAG: L-aspartate oxidase [Halobacteria archaeon]|nr:L-aspartate oxidase [Halobacteria archaeon]